MSLPRKGLRKITVQGSKFEWTIRKRPTSGQLYHKKKLLAAVQIVSESDKGLLLIDFGVSPPGNWRNPHKTSVTPQIIEAAITKALKEGWDPLKKATYEISFLLQYIPDPENLSPNAEFDIRWDENNQK